MKSRTGGKASRFWPGAALLHLAAEHGSLPTAFNSTSSRLPPGRHRRFGKPIVVNSLKQTIGYRSGQGVRTQLPETALGPELERIRAGVNAGEKMHRHAGVIMHQGRTHGGRREACRRSASALTDRFAFHSEA